MGKRTYFVSFLVLKKVRMGWNWTGLSPREQKETERWRKRAAIWNELTLLFDHSTKETGLSHGYLSVLKLVRCRGAESQKQPWQTKRRNGKKKRRGKNPLARPEYYQRKSQISRVSVHAQKWHPARIGKPQKR